jgi:hypothetical protein
MLRQFTDGGFQVFQRFLLGITTGNRSELIAVGKVFVFRLFYDAEYLHGRPPCTRDFRNIVTLSSVQGNQDGCARCYCRPVTPAYVGRKAGPGRVLENHRLASLRYEVGVGTGLEVLQASEQWLCASSPSAWRPCSTTTWRS